MTGAARQGTLRVTRTSYRQVGRAPGGFWPRTWLGIQYESTRGVEVLNV
jgi:hypothetical protein